MSKIPVMLVDDSKVVREFLKEIINSQKDMHVTAAASNGIEALGMIAEKHPKIVILDYQMPEMNGLETLEQIIKLYPGIKVIMFSSYTTQGAKLTIKALTSGAADFLPKPGSKGIEMDNAGVYLEEKLVPKIRELSRSNYRKNKVIEDIKIDPVRNLRQKVFDKKTLALEGCYNYCAVGISTGGTIALKKLLSRVPGDINGSILITIHMPAMFTCQLAEDLNKNSELKVFEAKDGMTVEKGAAYITPGSHHMKLIKSGIGLKIVLLDSPPYKSCKPSVNIMFSSLLDISPAQTIAVIMTGMGDDGYEAMLKLHRKNAYLLAQDKDSCVVFGMPSKPVKEKLVHDSLDIQGLAERISFLLGTNNV